MQEINLFYFDDCVNDLFIVTKEVFLKFNYQGIEAMHNTVLLICNANLKR